MGFRLLSRIGCALFLFSSVSSVLADSCADVAMYCNGDRSQASMCSAAQIQCNDQRDAEARPGEPGKPAWTTSTTGPLTCTASASITA